MLHKIYYIYKITNTINNKVYIGYAQHPNYIFSKFKCDVKKSRLIQPIHEEMYQFGSDKFKLEIISATQNISDIENDKNKIIEQYKADDKNFGYNFIKRGSKPGCKPSPGGFKSGNIPWNLGVSNNYIQFSDKKLYVVINECFGNYKDGNLTIQEYYDLAIQNCYWCNSPPTQIRKARNNPQVTWIKNGLDRKDNSLPHNKDNVIPCCWKCNNAKGKMSHEEFSQWIKQVYNNTVNK